MEKGKFAWGDFSNLNNVTDLENYIKYRKPTEKELRKTINDKYQYQRAYNHSNFFHYTKLKNIEKILKGNAFLLSRIGNSNDPIENNTPNKERSFALCFSTGINENLPLWYLYSGVNGKGGRLCFTKSQIYSLINEGCYSLVEINSETNEINSEICKLHKNEDISVEFQDILYVKENKEFIDLKYNTMTNHSNIRIKEFKEFERKYPAFIKSLIWYYEKETRLLVTLKDNIFQLLESNKKYAVKLSFDKLDDVINGMKLTLAPEFALNDEGELKTDDEIDMELRKNTNINRWLVNTSRYKKSEYSGQVKMQLCKKCDK